MSVIKTRCCRGWSLRRLPKVKNKPLTAQAEGLGFEFWVVGPCARDGVYGKKHVLAFPTHFCVLPLLSFHFPDAKGSLHHIQYFGFDFVCRGNCFICKCRFGVSVIGGEFRVFLH